MHWRDELGFKVAGDLQLWCQYDAGRIRGRQGKLRGLVPPQMLLW